MHEPLWLTWAKQIQAIAQTGLTYGKDVYDLERYTELRKLSVEIMESYTQAGTEQITLAFAGEKGYATPKSDVRGVVFRDNRILLVQEKSDGCWSLPGGWAEIGLSPTESIIKEIREEAGFEAQAVRLLAVMDRKFHHQPPGPYHIYTHFILCQIVGGEAASGVETSGVGFFAEDELPPLSLSRNTPAQISRMFAYLHNPDLPVSID